MAVPEQIPVVNYVADGVVKKFDVPFEYDQQSDLHIYVDGVEPTIDKYFFADNAFNFYIAPTVGQDVKIKRITPKERDTDYDLHTNTVRPKALNSDFDRLWYVLQEVFSDVGGLSQAVQDEIIARIQGDEDLLNQLTAEISARMLGDEAVTEDLKNYVDQVIGAIINDPDFDGIDAKNVNDASGETQQQVNYNGGSKWHSRAGGYKENERVVLANGDIVKSTVNGNVNDPNVDMTGWRKPQASEIFDESGFDQQYLNNIYNSQILTTDQFPKWVGELDDTPRLQRAFDESALRKQCLHLVGDFNASEPLYASHNMQGSDSTITYPQDYAGLGLVISAEKNASNSTRLYRKRLWLPTVITSKTSSGNNWTSNSGSTGIKLVNPMECKFWFGETYFWETNVHIAAIGTDANYNEFYFGTHTFSKKCLYIEINGTTSKASCNQNRYISGRFAVNNAAARTAGVYLIHAEIKGANASSFNNSDFSTNSVEGSGDEVAIYIQNSGDATNTASYNTINGARLETGNVAGKKIVFDGVNVRWNDVIGGYGILVDNIEYRNGAGQTSLSTTSGNISLNGNAGGGTRPLLSLKHSGGVNSPTAMGFATSVADINTNSEAYASWVLGGQTFAVGVAGQDYKRFNLTYSSGAMRWGSGVADFDTTLTRLNGQGLKLDRKFMATQGIGVGNAQDATTIPTAGLVKKIQIFDENGASLGFIPVYSSIT